jgi:hypothetical protein
LPTNQRQTTVDRNVSYMRRYLKIICIMERETELKGREGKLFQNERNIS